MGTTAWARRFVVHFQLKTSQTRTEALKEDMGKLKNNVESLEGFHMHTQIQELTTMPRWVWQPRPLWLSPFGKPGHPFLTKLWFNFPWFCFSWFDSYDDSSYCLLLFVNLFPQAQDWRWQWDSVYVFVPQCHDLIIMGFSEFLQVTWTMANVCRVVCQRDRK